MVAARCVQSGLSMIWWATSRNSIGRRLVGSTGATGRKSSPMVLLVLVWLAFRVTLNPPGQYADDRQLRARQRFWLYQDPQFDIVNWVLDLAGPSPGMRVLDAGCGNGWYLCDLSPGMLRAAADQAGDQAGHPAVLNADVTALPLRDGAVDVALAIHMLYHEI